MPAFAGDKRSMLYDPRYSDLEIVCEGKIFPVHRIIVCPKSVVLARECDESAKASLKSVIEIPGFSTSTVEQLLQFIYEGDYTLDLGDAKTNGASPLDGKDGADCDELKSLPSNKREILKEAANAKALTTPAKSDSDYSSEAMEAHICVYAIAEAMGIPSLKTLALEKFKNAKVALSAKCLLNVIKLSFSATTDVDDLLRKEVLTILITEYSSWLASDEFVALLNREPNASEFALSLASAMAKRSITSELQATANKLLLSDLDVANQALIKSSQRNKDLEADLKKREGEIRTLRAEASSTATARVNVEKQTKELEAVHATTVGKFQTRLLQKDDQLKAADLKLKNEVHRFDKIQIVCIQKDAKILEEKARADNGKAIVQSIVDMINNVPGCRHCGEELNWCLQADDRTWSTHGTEQPYNFMLRCTECRMKEYGNLIHQL